MDTVLRRDELILAVTLPPARFDKHAHYLKARDRKSYTFGLVTVAAGLEMNDGVVTSACLALGAVASKPWRVSEAEEVLLNKCGTIKSFQCAADILLSGAQGYAHNSFFVLIVVTLKAGRTDALKEAFYRGVVDKLSIAPGMRPEDVGIVLHENAAADWSFGNGIAQLLQSTK